MKKIYFTILSVLTIGALMTASAQQQPNNGDFELWDNVGQTTEEPTDWSGMMTGNLCGACGFGASQRIFKDVTEFHGGTASARIQTTSVITGAIVNGAMTTGKIVAPNTNPANGYNQTFMGEAGFNHPFTDMPDSVVVWAKYNITDSSDSARMSIVLHDAYDLRDPQDAASIPHVVAKSSKNFQTGGTASWRRLSIPIDYSGASPGPTAYALITFTSSYIAGAGNNTAKLWVDDLEFIYNPDLTSVQELAQTLRVYPNPSADGNVTISLGSDFGNGTVTVLNVMGQTVGELNFVNENVVKVQIDQPSGMYFLNIRTEDGQSITVRVIKG